MSSQDLFDDFVEIPIYSDEACTRQMGIIKMLKDYVGFTFYIKEEDIEPTE